MSARLLKKVRGFLIDRSNEANDAVRKAARSHDYGKAQLNEGMVQAYEFAIKECDRYIETSKKQGRHAE